MAYYARRLPHFQPEGAALFVTFRLFGSLPKGRFFSNQHVTAGRAFVTMDRLLDGAGTGPTWLGKEEVAKVVEDALFRGERDLRRYELHAHMVMPNHVHLLLTPSVPLGDVLRSVKGFTAHECNRLLGRKGAFWQGESYDRWVRSEEEFARISRYIEQNPVKAGMVGEASEWRWSSAYRRGQVGEDVETRA